MTTIQLADLGDQPRLATAGASAGVSFANLKESPPCFRRHFRVMVFSIYAAVWIDPVKKRISTFSGPRRSNFTNSDASEVRMGFNSRQAKRFRRINQASSIISRLIQ